MLKSLTDPKAVISAIQEFDQIGRDAFLDKYGFGSAKSYWLVHNGKQYDSKAIAGVAFGYQHPKSGPLRSSQFSGGEISAKKHLSRLGFDVKKRLEIQSEKKPRNPVWSRNELILALDLYMQHRRRLPEADSAEISSLSTLLRSLHQQRTGSLPSATYRNGNGVYLKLSNFRRLDPQYTKDGRSGMSHGAHSEEAIWSEFHDRLPALSDEAARLKERYSGRAAATGGQTGTSLSIAEIAHALNARASQFAIGQLQDIRATLHGGRRSARTVFSDQTIYANYAFHHGGRKELQFNIGIETRDTGTVLRYGVAFSFKLSQSLPTLDVLLPKVKLFNDFLAAHPDLYQDLKMWVWRGKSRDEETTPSLIGPDIVQPNTFVFLGQTRPDGNLDYAAMLEMFDRLLPLYEFIESRGAIQFKQSRTPFTFAPGHNPRSRSATVSSSARDFLADVKHAGIQDALYAMLCEAHGKKNVRTEQPTGGGTKIDAVAKSKDGYDFYEIKTSASPRACLREAIGQLLEYSLWPGAERATRLIVVGETEIDAEGSMYLERLKSLHKLPLEYLAIKEGQS